ncbi:hypothetical protein Dsin_025052 [Dipteronia sinensis]|uniref:Uncharacterized protein n=1 Tax=Dipteronia sinensis TaxID=43782 RepID=A0AAE0DWL0_9ROSI|nr:hypothetical protein Dsin_025052 [Dipteronia sinensis]
MEFVKCSMFHSVLLETTVAGLNAWISFISMHWQLKKMQFLQEFLSCFIFSTSQVGPASKEPCLHCDRDIQLHAHNPKEGTRCDFILMRTQLCGKQFILSPSLLLDNIAPLA